MRRPVAAVLAFVASALSPAVVSGYSVLAHQAVVDAAWERSLRPALQARYRLTDEGMREARAYAYGGCLIQDLGYYPFASRFFGNLTHYVRSGDFIEALFRESTNAQELAFALGALAHYAADTRGHALAVNRAVPLVYPELRRKFGDVVTYEQHPVAHLKTEFGFDVLQVARGRYAPDAYHDFIGFQVATGVLGRAFHATYGLELEKVFGKFDFTITTFRWAVTTTIPELTKVAWESRREEITALDAKVTREQFVFASSRADFEKRWGTEYKKPGWGHRLLSWLLRIVPRFGPFRPLAFRTPTPEAQKLFAESFEATVERYRSLVASAPAGVAIDNRNLDNGEPVTSGTYRLVDETYADWLDRLGEQRFATVTAPMRTDLLRFYKARQRPPHVSEKHWKKTVKALTALGDAQ